MSALMRSRLRDGHTMVKLPTFTSNPSEPIELPIAVFEGASLSPTARTLAMMI